MVLEVLINMTLKNYKIFIELCFNGVIKVLKNRGNLKFICDKEDPGKTGMVINESYKPLFPRRASDLGWIVNGCEENETWCCLARIQTS